MDDIDRLSRRVPVLCKVAPAKSDVHMEDVHRAGGIFAILGELERAGLLNAECPTVHAASLGEAINRWDIRRTNSKSVREFFLAAPGGVPTQVAFSQERRWDDLDLDRAKGVIRAAETPFSKDGGLGRSLRQHRHAGLHREDGGRGREHSQVLRPRHRVRKPGLGGAGHPEWRGEGGRRCGDPLRGPDRRARACRRCCIPPATSSRRGWGRPARC
jgi:hypothetical protein